MEQGQHFHSPLPAGARAALAAALLILFWLSWVAVQPPPKWDLAFRDAVHARASAPMTVAMNVITQLGAASIAISVGFLAALLLLKVKRWRPAAILFAATAGAEILGQILKAVYHRPRPRAFFGMTTPHTGSFPSTHAMISFCLFSGLAIIIAAQTRTKVLKAAIWTAAVLIVLAVGYSRVYLGVHYLSDVVGGYAIAALWSYLLCATIGRIGSSR